MISRRHFIGAVTGLVYLASPLTAIAADKLTVVTSFSILGDMAKQVGGDHVEVVMLVGPDGDTHAYEPSPANVRAMADAKLLIINGLGLEGWLPRLVKTSGFSGVQVTASHGAELLKWEEDEHEARDKDGDEHHEEAAHHDEGEHHHGEYDPHAWQSLANGAIYARNITDALTRLDPDNAADYESRAKRYIDYLEALHEKLKADFAAIPAERRRVVTSHDAFHYFGHAYGIDFVAPEGVSTEAEASAGAVAKIIDQIRREKLTAVFLENISDERLIRRIAAETDVRIGGELYSDALSSRNGPARDYVSMFEYNASQLLSALTGS